MLMLPWSTLAELNDSIFLAKLAETGGNPRELLRRGFMSSLVAW